MRRLTVAAVALASFAAVPIPAVAAPGRQHDHRPCVSKAEFQAAKPATEPGAPTFTRPELEKWWDVQGMGRFHRTRQLGGLPVFWYPACGYTWQEKRFGAVFREDMPHPKGTGLDWLTVHTAYGIPGCDVRACRGDAGRHL